MVIAELVSSPAPTRVSVMVPRLIAVELLTGIVEDARLEKIFPPVGVTRSSRLTNDNRRRRCCLGVDWRLAEAKPSCEAERKYGNTGTPWGKSHRDQPNRSARRCANFNLARTDGTATRFACAA